MEGEDEIEIGEVYDGEEVAKYQGKRNIEELRSFVLKEAENAATRAQVASDKEL